MASYPQTEERKTKIKYPYFEPTSQGIRVRVNHKTSLPGVFTDELRARKALAAYLAAPKVTKKKEDK